MGVEDRFIAESADRLQYLENRSSICKVRSDDVFRDRFLTVSGVGNEPFKHRGRFGSLEPHTG